MISDLNAQLEYERIRREKLEVQLDELRLENSRLRDEIDMMNANNQVSAIIEVTFLSKTTMVKIASLLRVAEGLF